MCGAVSSLRQYILKSVKTVPREKRDRTHPQYIDMRVASLVATGLLAANGLVVAPLQPAPHAARAADPTNFFDLKKMIDPENAMEAGSSSTRFKEVMALKRALPRRSAGRKRRRGSRRRRIRMAVAVDCPSSRCPSYPIRLASELKEKMKNK